MSQAEALRRALAELGEVPAEELAAHMAAYGVRVRPQFVPVLKATLRDKEILAQWRRKGEEAAQASKSPPAEGQPLMG